MSRDRVDERLETLLARAHQQLGIVVYDGLMGSGGPPELRDPDQMLGSLLAAAHRRTGEAVAGRLARRHGKEHGERVVADGVARAENLLMRRLAVVRLKYRQRAMDCAREHWPLNVVTVIEKAVDAVQELITGLEEEDLVETACDRLVQVSRSMGRVLALPGSATQPTPALGGYDYLEEVEEYLSTCSARLVAQARRSKQLLDSELIPHFHAPELSCLGMLELAQDLSDDLDLAHREALSLSRAVAAVKEASTDFRGADLRSADLAGADLEGIRWDASTVWPPEWKERIWKASLAAANGHGELIVGVEPHGSTVAVDL
ncbi:pentapeptide repeat-containing protein [Streptomyces sp. NPDC059881]|uniref:pentapeptide repeat-containing protein n=1 Tax=Streptomyces sp. NPDC059881 TaxID=3346986 RepID=UPI00365A1659